MCHIFLSIKNKQKTYYFISSTPFVAIFKTSLPAHPHQYMHEIKIPAFLRQLILIYKYQILIISPLSEVRNAQATITEKPQMKIKSFENKKRGYLIQSKLLRVPL